MAGPGGHVVGRVSVKVSPDTERFRPELRRQLDAVERTLQLSVRVVADLESGMRARLNAEIAALEHSLRAIHIRVEVDQTRAVMMSRLRGQMDQLGTSATAAGKGFSGLSGSSGLLAAAITSLLSPALALVVGLMASLPSLIGAGGAAIAAITLGLDGIKKAASTLQPQVDKLKATLSTVFEQRLTPQFEQLGQIFPILESGLSRVANGLADMSQGFVDVVTSARGMAQVDSILQKSGQFFSQLKPFVTDLTSSFLTMADAGARNFGLLSTSLNGFSSRFSALIEKLNANGQFDKMFQGLSATFDGLGNAFNSLFESGVNAMGKLGPEMGRFLTTFGTLVKSAEPILSSLSENVFKVLGQLGISLAPILDKLSPGLTKLMDLIGGGLSKAIEVLGKVLEPVAGALSNAFLAGLKSIEPLLPKLSEALTQMGDALAKAFSDPKFAQALSDFATNTLPKLMDLAIQLTPILTNLLTTFATALPYLVQFESLIGGNILTNLSRLVGLFTTVGDALKGMGDKLIVFIALLPQTLESAFNSVKDTVTNALTTIGGTISSVGSAITSAWSTVWESAKEIVSTAWETVKSTVQTGIDNVVSFVSEVPGKVTAALGDLGSVLFSAGVDLIQGLINGIRSMISAAVGAARSVAGAVADAAKSALGINSPSKVFTEFGEFVGQGLVNGINSQVNAARKAATGLADATAEPFEGMGSRIDKAFQSSKIADVPAGFAAATGQQFLSDLGVQGTGAIPTAFKEIGNYIVHYHVTDIDEAMRKEQNRKNREALQYNRR